MIGPCRALSARSEHWPQVANHRTKDEKRGLVLAEGDDAHRECHPIWVVVPVLDLQAVYHTLGQEHLQGLNDAVGSGSGFPHEVRIGSAKRSSGSPSQPGGFPAGVAKVLVAPVFVCQGVVHLGA